MSILFWNFLKKIGLPGFTVFLMSPRVILVRRRAMTLLSCRRGLSRCCGITFNSKRTWLGSLSMSLRRSFALALG
jgi:hypothetical protein